MRIKQIEICKDESNLHNRIYHLKTLGKDCEMVRIIGDYYLYRTHYYPIGEREYEIRYHVIKYDSDWSYYVHDFTKEEIKRAIRFISNASTADLCSMFDSLWELDPVPTRSNKPRLCV